MDNRTSPSVKESCESSLTESWDVVVTQEINNTSEGSDGESIEVIEEDTNADSCFTKTIEKSENPVWESAVSKDAESTVQQFSSKVYDPHENKEIAVPTVTGSVRSDGLNLFTACFFLALLISVILSGATVSLFLYKFEEFAFSQLKYILSYSSDNSANEYQELLEQIKTYKEESQDLKGIVADLNAAVTSLRKELVTKNEKKISRGFSEKNLNDENKLFEQLLSIQPGNLLTENYSEGNLENYENSFKIIQDMLKRLTVGDEREENLETVKLFYFIPKHLTVLGSHYLSNENIRQFIDFWKEKLSVVNGNLIGDLKEMQLKMIRHTVRHLKNTEKSFFKELCDLQNFNKAECYAAFIKPYENTDDPVIEEKPFDDEQSEKDEFVTKSESDRSKKNSVKKDPEHKKEIKNNQFKKYVDNKLSANSNDDDKAFNVHSNEILSGQQKNGNQKKQKTVVKPSQPKNIKNKEKGMDDVIRGDESTEEGASTNSFSSFSKTGYEGSSVKGWRMRREWRRPAEDSWFLRLGQHRSRLRCTQARRARYLKRRSYIFRQPFYLYPPNNAEDYSDKFLKSQGFF